MTPVMAPNKDLDKDLSPEASPRSSEKGQLCVGFRCHHCVCIIEEGQPVYMGLAPRLWTTFWTETRSLVQDHTDILGSRRCRISLMLSLRHTQTQTYMSNCQNFR
eukprot:g19879.t1